MKNSSTLTSSPALVASPSQQIGSSETSNTSSATTSHSRKKSSRSTGQTRPSSAILGLLHTPRSLMIEETPERFRARMNGKRKNETGRPTGWSENWLEVATRLCRVDDGLPRRMDRNPRLKALGNAIVPQVAEEIMRAIKSTIPPTYGK